MHCLYIVYQILESDLNSTGKSFRADITFEDLMLDSLMMVVITSEITEKLGLDLSPQDSYNHPTLADFVHYICSEVGVGEQVW